jgi:hypothetical protein
MIVHAAGLEVGAGIYEPPGILIKEGGAKQYSIGHAEDCRTRTDTQRECDDGGGRKRGAGPQCADRVEEVPTRSVPPGRLYRLFSGTC